jgi:hypothetical protein
MFNATHHNIRWPNRIDSDRELAAEAEPTGIVNGGLQQRPIEGSSRLVYGPNAARVGRRYTRNSPFEDGRTTKRTDAKDGIVGTGIRSATRAEPNTKYRPNLIRIRGRGEQAKKQRNAAHR